MREETYDIMHIVKDKIKENANLTNDVEWEIGERLEIILGATIEATLEYLEKQRLNQTKYRHPGMG